jgi:LuxR family maltose regulon positive regulatory protein
MPVDDLLHTKLAPPRPHAGWVRRGGLFGRLERGLEQKMTLLTAPTGFGKTTLVSAWLADQNRPAAWVALDEGDNDPVRFWRYVIAAFQRLDPEIGKTSLGMLRVARQPAYERLLVALINDLARLPGQTILVLDDLHAVTAQEVLEPLLFLIERLPPNLHVLACARSEPALPVAVLRARGELNELRAADLRFSQSEIETFLSQALPFRLSESAVLRLAQKTEGWPAGVRLITLAMQAQDEPAGRAEQFIETFNGEHRYVLEYLRREVFDKQPEDARGFLLRTCFLERLCGPLCDAVTGQAGGAVLLERLVQANLFVIPFGPARRSLAGDAGGETGLAWYRYQSLFAEALRREAARVLGEGAVLELAEKASAWYESRELLEEAIDSALAARQVDRALGLVERFIDQRWYSEVLSLLRWCDQIPPAALDDHPQVAFQFALAHLFGADRFSPATADRVRPLLRAAEEAWSAAGNRAAIGRVYAIRGTLSWWQGDPAGGFADMRRALELLPENDPLEDGLLWRGTALLGAGEEARRSGDLADARACLLEAQALCGAVQNLHGVLAAVQMLAIVDFQQGALDQAAARNKQVLAEAVGGDEMLDDQAAAWLGLAEIAYERNDLRAAGEQAVRALELSARRSYEVIWVPASILLARVAQARGETGPALTSLQSILPRIRQPDLLHEARLALARLCLAAGDLAEARRWHGLAAGQPGSLFAADLERRDLLAARLLLAEGRPEDACALAHAQLETARTQARLRGEVEILSVEALALDAQGRQEPALQTLTAVLELGQPRGLRRSFLDEGASFAHLLQAAIPRLPRRSLSIYASTLLQSAAAGQPARAGIRLPVEPLSPQEIRVLSLLAAGRSNPQIAEELVVSINTVKTQVQSIYRKLNVNTRAEARAAAEQLSISRPAARSG